MDRAGTLIARLLDARDVLFSPPPFDAAVATDVLGPSGGMLTPHRRLLERQNGAYVHDHTLHHHNIYQLYQYVHRNDHHNYKLHHSYPLLLRPIFRGSQCHVYRSNIL